MADTLEDRLARVRQSTATQAPPAGSLEQRLRAIQGNRGAIPRAAGAIVQAAPRATVGVLGSAQALYKQGKQAFDEVVKAARGVGEAAVMASPVGAAAQGLELMGVETPIPTPLKMYKGMARQSTEQIRKAREKLKERRYGAAVGHAAAAIPIVGPAGADIARNIKERKPGAVAADIAMLAAPGVGGEEALARANEFAAGRLAARGAKWSDMLSEAIQGIKPRASKVDFRSTAERAIPEITEASKQELGRLPQNVGDLIAGSEAAEDKLWNQNLQPYLDAASKAGVRINGKGIREARIDTIPYLLEHTNPDRVAALQEVAGRFDKEYTVDEAQRLIADINAQRSAYYNKFPTERFAAKVSDPGMAADIATADYLRHALYDEIASRTGGKLKLPNGAELNVPAEIKKRWGAVREMRKGAERRQIIAMRQNPTSLAQQAGNIYSAKELADAGFNIVTGRWSRAVEDAFKAGAVRYVAGLVKKGNTSDDLVRRTFEEYNKGPALKFAPESGAYIGPLPPPVPPTARPPLKPYEIVQGMQERARQMSEGPKQLPEVKFIGRITQPPVYRGRVSRQITGSVAPGPVPESISRVPLANQPAQGPVTKGTPAPPPLNIQPRGPGAIGPAGTVPVRSTETGTPMPARTPAPKMIGPRPEVQKMGTYEIEDELVRLRRIKKPSEAQTKRLQALESELKTRNKGTAKPPGV
jgi:hypothetical protein